MRRSARRAQIVVTHLMLACGAVCLPLLASGPAAAAGLAPRAPVPSFTTTLGHASPRSGVVTIPYFSDSFSYGGVTYPYDMVGTNPETTTATTIVPTVILPLRFVFADGNVAGLGNVVAQTIASPLFKPASFSSGNTQYGDAIRRAMFWTYDGGTSYHVLLRKPVVLPTVTLNVPAADGVFLHAGDPSGPPALGFHVAADTGVVLDSWFYSQFDSLLNKTLAPGVLPIVLSRNIALSSSPIPYGAPTVGFHTAAAAITPSGKERIQTAIWASYAVPNVITELPGILQNTDVLSHEISEWMHDPFLNNQVPTWISPLPLSAAIYGCSSLLETGDPMSDVAFEVNGYQLQEEAFLSWFAHQVPSIGINGQYSFLGTVTQPSPLC
jgi:hypothetical protein